MVWVGVSSSKTFRPKRQHGYELNEWTLDADGHHSMCVNVLNELGDKCDQNRAVLIEALLSIKLSVLAEMVEDERKKLKESG